MPESMGKIGRSTMSNRYAGRCVYCSGHVPAKGGSCFKQGRRYVVAHRACSSKKSPAVITFGGDTWSGSVNANGRCEDAPCCGCCS